MFFEVSLAILLQNQNKSIATVGVCCKSMDLNHARKKKSLTAWTVEQA